MSLPAALFVLMISAGAPGGASSAFSSKTASGPAQRHFEDVSGDLPNEAITAVAVDPNDDEVVYTGTDGFLFRSDDAGESWRPVLSFPRGVAIDPTDTETRSGILNNLDDLPSTGELDYGEAADLRGGGDLRDDLPSDEEMPEGEDGASYDPADASGAAMPDGDAQTSASFDVVSWPREMPGVRAIAFVPGSPGVVYVATPRGAWRSTSSGEAFERVAIPGGVLENDVRDIVVDPQRPSRVYLATAAGLFLSRDGGTSFERGPGQLADNNTLCVTAGVIDGAVHVFVGTARGLWRSTNDGVEFNQMLLKGASAFVAVGAVAVAIDGEITYAGTALGLFSGERGSAILERYGGLPPVQVASLSPDTLRKRGIAVGTVTQGVAFSLDSGLTRLETDNVPAAEVLGLARPRKESDALWVATERGLFKSAPGSGIVISTSALKSLRTQWSREPSLQRSVDAALGYARIDPNLYGEMRARAGVANLLPRVTARYTFAFGRTVNTREYVLRAGDELPAGIDPDNDNVDLFGNTGFVVLSPAEGYRHALVVELRWDLDQLVLNPDEVRASRQQPFHHAAQRRIISSVQESFAARRRLMTEIAMEQKPRGDGALEARVRDELRLEELTAQLDGATGGLFSNFTGESAGDFTSESDSLSSKEAP